jgi:hypothetical protein
MGGAVRKRGVRERSCLSCGLVEYVRRDNVGERCRPCAQSARVGLFTGLIAEKEPNCACAHCGLKMRRSPSAIGAVNYCGRACRDESRRVSRDCKHCGKSFVTQVGRLSGKTNSSANFCGRECYWASMRKPVKAGKLAGGAWQRTSAATIKRTPFCGCCGKSRGRLETHHILPRRIGGSDEQSNLIPLCPPCHKRVESSTKAMEKSGVSAETVGWFMTIRLRYRQFLTVNTLKKIANDRAHQAA